MRKSIESMTGLHVEKVDLHVVGVSFEKENQEMQQSQKLALTIEEEKEQPAPEEAIAEEETADDAEQGEFVPDEEPEDEQAIAEDEAEPEQKPEGEEDE